MQVLYAVQNRRNRFLSILRLYNRKRNVQSQLLHYGQYLSAVYMYVLSIITDLHISQIWEARTEHFVNGRKPTPNSETQLNDGDKVTIADEKFTYSAN